MVDLEVVVHQLNAHPQVQRNPRSARGPRREADVGWLCWNLQAIETFKKFKGTLQDRFKNLMFELLWNAHELTCKFLWVFC